MKKLIFVTVVAFLYLHGGNLNAQESKPEQRGQESGEPPPPPPAPIQSPPAVDRVSPSPAPEVKRIAPARREGAARRLQARPPRDNRPEIIRPGGETRPAGAGRPRGVRRPAR